MIKKIKKTFMLVVAFVCVKTVFLTELMAQAPILGTSKAGETNPLASFAPLLLIGVFAYFLLIRPQQKAAKEHKEKLKALKKGDMVVMNGGLIGKIHKLSDNEITLTIAKDTNVQVIRSSVSLVKDTSKAVASKVVKTKAKS